MKKTMNISIKREQNNARISSAEREKFGAKLNSKILSPLRRDGYKAGMIMMLIALSTMLLTTSCSSEDDLVNNTANTENTINKGYALPVTVNVTRGGDATTRATYTYDEGTKKGTLSFSEGDKLFVWSYNGGSAGAYAGVLDWVSDGTFSGTITTQNPYTGTIDALLSGGTPAAAVLLPAGYGDYGYLSTEGNSGSYSDGYTEDYTKAFVASTTEKTAKALAVEQFSFESANYSGGFALEPNNAILSFTITGLTASTNVTATIKKGEDVLVSGSVTTDGSGNATFAMGIESAAEINPLTLTVGGKEITITSTNTVFDAGKIYNISRSAAEQEVAGSYFTANSSGTKVVFSPGNLQYQASTNTWRFAEHQYDYVGYGGTTGGNVTGSNNTLISSTYAGWIDLFGWGTSGKTFASGYGTAYQPYATSNTSTAYGPTGTSNGLYGTFANGDWGVNMTGTYSWRTLTGGEGGEWEWIIGPYDYDNPGTNCRASDATVNGISDVRYTLATINTDGTPVNCIILFPDGCKINSSSATNWGYFDTDSDWGTKCTTAQWTHLEELGCVFLPAAGCRDGAVVDEVGTDGYYWSSSPDPSDADYAHNVYFGSSLVAPGDFYDRYYGYSVRLVREVEVP